MCFIALWLSALWRFCTVAFCIVAFCTVAFLHSVHTPIVQRYEIPSRVGKCAYTSKINATGTKICYFLHPYGKQIKKSRAWKLLGILSLEDMEEITVTLFSRSDAHKFILEWVTHNEIDKPNDLESKWGYQYFEKLHNYWLSICY